MRTHREISQDAFDRFLAWLDADREQAGTKYESIRRKLIKIFICRGCPAGEELADETINRVIVKIQELADSYVGDPAAYFCGVARNVHLEYLKKNPLPVVPLEPDCPQQPDPPQQKEREYQCLEQCLDSLSDENRRLVLEYYQREKQARISHRRDLAERLGIAPNALRIRMYRIRSGLQVCVEQCVNHSQG